MVCANLLIGDAGVLAMPADVLGRWHEDKIEALVQALEKAKGMGAEQCLLAGGLFAEGFIPQTLFEEAIEELGNHDVSVTYLPMDREAIGLDLRVKLPESITVVRKDSYEPFKGLRIVHKGSDIEMALTTPSGVSLVQLGLLEPMGFGDQSEAGFLLVEVEDGMAVIIDFVPCALHPFVSKAVDMSGCDSSKEMLSAVQSAIGGIAENACLRLVLRGNVSLATYFNTDNLASVLGRKYFYAEVANECGIDLDEKELASDVSLLAEFVRIVSADDSLSPTEKTKIMRCGWNALNGKELAE